MLAFGGGVDHGLSFGAGIFRGESQWLVKRISAAANGDENRGFAIRLSRQEFSHGQLRLFDTSERRNMRARIGVLAIRGHEEAGLRSLDMQCHEDEYECKRKRHAGQVKRFFHVLYCALRFGSRIKLTRMTAGVPIMQDFTLCQRHRHVIMQPPSRRKTIGKVMDEHSRMVFP